MKIPGKPGAPLGVLGTVLMRGSLVAAIAVPGAAFAADAASGTQSKKASSQPMEEVVVTGSLVRGTPEDAALPVDVHTAMDLENNGSPSALEFVKSLTVSGPTTGESYYFSGGQLSNDVGFNLRGLGPDKTLTLFNGRRLSGNTTSTVAGGAANTAMLPSIVLQRIEILKDGAAVTYGADATGGVVNYITRDSYTGFTVKANYKYFDGSNGDYGLSMMGGFGEGDTNVIIAGEWNHRSELDTTKRDFASLPYAVNPAPWSTLTNLAGYVARASLPATPGNTPNTEFGSPLGLVTDFTQSSCEAVGGVYRDGYTCKYDYVPYYNLVEKNNTYRLFLQVNSAISDKSDFHLQAIWARIHLPHVIGSPAQPVIRGPARGEGAAYQFYVPMTNPYVADFVQRTGWDQSPYYGYTQGFTPITYRAFAHGGNPTYSVDGNYGMPTEVDNRYIHVEAGFKGTTWKDIGYDVGVTYNQSTEFGTFPDVIGYRLQEALSGFGGPNCHAADLDPNRFGTQNPAAAGQGDCMYWNPFASGWSGQPVLGLSNPSYVPGSENPDNLVRWIFDPRAYEDISWNATLDAVFNGTLPLELPGGNVAWGFGTQWRTTQLRINTTDPLYNGTYPCAWPTQDQADPTDPTYTGCTPDRPGPFVFFDTNPPDSQHQDQFSYFAELDFPVTDSVYLTAAARHEDFTGDLSADVYKFSGKWQATENLAFRGSYGTNYQAPGLGIIPGQITNGVNSYTVAGGNWRGAQTITLSGITPETATVWSVGGIWQSRGFTDGSDVQVLVDYWDIETKDELGLLATANDVANAVFSLPNSGGYNLADCSSPFIGRVTFNGSCVQGVTTADDFSNITTDYGNGPGQRLKGVDLSVTYTIPAFSGELSFGLKATNTQKFEYTPTILDGVVLKPAEDRLGYLNFATIAQAAPRWRANFSVNYSTGPQNVRLVINYVSPVRDDRYVGTDGQILDTTFHALTPEGTAPGTSGPFAPSFYGLYGKPWFSADLHYNIDTQFGTISASINNITDEDPPPAREELGYDPRMGNPLGRVLQVGIRKEF